MNNPRLTVKGAKKSKPISLKQGSNIGGRADYAGIRLRGDNASREHFIITITANNAEIADLESRNGTYVNDRRVEKQELKWGDRVRAASEEFLFLFDEKDETASSGDSLVNGAEVTVLSSNETSLSRWPASSIRAGYVDAIFRICTELINLDESSILEKLAAIIAEAAEFNAVSILDETGSALYPTQEKSESVSLTPEIIEQVTAQARVAFEKSEHRCIIAAPIKDQEIVTGIIACTSEKAPEGGSLRFLSAAGAQTGLILANARNRAGLRRSNQQLKSELGSPDILGESPAIHTLKKMIQRVGPTDAAVLIQGESGTGKELCARAIHDASRFSDGPFVSVNCGAIPRELMESELFGHEKGSFTGAGQQRTGLFEEADQGTLFLDEIGELSHDGQVKLLRALEEKKIRRVGANRDIPVNIRLIAATNKDLLELSGQGDFRNDLYYRLQVVELHLPPLRERREDIPLLAGHFLAQAAERMSRPALTFSPKALVTLQKKEWTGNVRELKNCVERAVIFAEADSIQPRDLDVGSRPHDSQTPSSSGAATERISLSEIEKRHITAVLRGVSGNKSRAAEILGIARPTLYEKIKEHGIE